jgi:predicted nucleic acid-binding protein
MMILDTSVWIEYLKNNPNYFPKISKLLENSEILGIECIFGELLQGVKNKSEKEIIMNYWTYIPKEYFINVIIDAGIYSSENKFLDKGVGLIDAIILIHSMKTQYKIWTLDKKFMKVIPEELLYTNDPNVI